MILSRKKTAKVLFLVLLTVAPVLWKNNVVPAYAEEAAPLVTTEKTEENADAGDIQSPQTAEGEGKVDETPKTQAQIDEERGYTDMQMTRVKFAVFLCCCFGLGVSILVALYGKPNDDLRYRYKKARRKRKKEEKRKQKLEKKALKDGREYGKTDGDHQKEQ